MRAKKYDAEIGQKGAFCKGLDKLAGREEAYKCAGCVSDKSAKVIAYTFGLSVLGGMLWKKKVVF